MELQITKLEKGNYIYKMKEQTWNVKKAFYGWDVYKLSKGEKVLVKEVKKLADVKEFVSGAERKHPETKKHIKTIKSNTKKKINKIFNNKLKFQNYPKRPKKGLLFSAFLNKQSLAKFIKFTESTSWVKEEKDGHYTFAKKSELFVFKVHGQDLEVLLNFYTLSAQYEGELFKELRDHFREVV